jgi:hypothetical protein
MELKFATKPYIPTLVVSVVLFIMVFLPWVTISAFGFSASANGTHDWGILTMIMSIVGAAASFLAVEKTRAMATIGAGVLALLGVIIYMASNLGSGVGAGAGLIISLIVALALAAVGYMDLKKIGPFVKMSAGNKPTVPPANPPAPPPAQ